MGVSGRPRCRRGRCELRAVRGAAESASYALIAAMSGRNPMMFMTRVRL